MKKRVILLLLATFCLAGCVKVTFSGSDSSSSTVESSETEAVSLVQGTVPLNDEALEYVESLIKSHPDLGSAGSVTINYAVVTRTTEDGTTYAMFLVTNRTGMTLDKDFQFTVSWAYEDTVFLDNETVVYSVEESGVLENNTVGILYIPVSSEHVALIQSISDASQMTLTMADLEYVDEE